MIDICDVSFTYDGSAFALSGASEHIEKGEFVCILGGNGSGKSTLAKHLNALLIPDEGYVKVDGMDTADASCTYLIRKTAGMVFQNPDDQLVASLVEDDVAFGPENLGLDQAKLRRRVEDALKNVGLSGFERHETHALSGGQKQRVAIAGVLAMDPAVLILDEASAMLDPRGRSGLMRVCKELHERGFTIVMITHFMEEAACADRVLVMNAGKIVLSGAPQEVLTHAEELAKLNLEVPFATQLSLNLRAAGVEVAPTVDSDALAKSVLELALSRGLQIRTEHQERTKAAGIDKPATTPVESPSDSLTDGTATIVEFDHVSYTYDAAEAKRQRKRGNVRAEKQADWGNRPDSIWAISDVSFAVRPGEFLGIAGHTGSGKSTIIQHMNGILHPTSGRVLVNGRDIAARSSEQEARGTIGVVFQYPEHQLFAETVYKDVAFGPRNLGYSESEIDELVRQSLEQVGLSATDIAQKSPFELSGGQQRRVAFAGILAMKPQVLVLDEPAAGLDPASRKSFLKMISRFHAQGLTVVMVSHNMDDLAAMCDRVIVMNEGKMIFAGKPANLFLKSDELKNVGLGTTSAQSFALALSRRGFPLEDSKLYSKDDLVEAITSELAQ